MMGRTTLAPALTLATLMAACGGAEVPATFTQRDSAGVIIVESHSSAWEGSGGWTVDREPVLDLATSGTGPLHEFYNVRNAVRLEDGVIAVVDRGSSQVRFYDAEGKFVKAVGRAGAGPGEFRRPASIHRFRGDSLMVFDAAAGRATVLGTEDGGVRVIPLRMQDAMVSGLLPLDDTTLVARLPSLWVPEERDGINRKPEPLVRLSLTGEVIDTIGKTAGAEEFQWMAEGMTARPLFQKTASLAVFDGRIYLGSADRMEFEVRSAAGELERIVRVPAYDLGLSGEEVSAERDFLLDLYDQPRYRALFSAMPDPATRPAYSQLVLDGEGFVWAEEYRAPVIRLSIDEPSSWELFSPRGIWLGSVRLPGRFTVFQIGRDFILGSRYDHLDVEHVQLLRLHRDRDRVPIP